MFQSTQGSAEIDHRAGGTLSSIHGPGHVRSPMSTPATRISGIVVPGSNPLARVSARACSRPRTSKRYPVWSQQNILGTTPVHIHPRRELTTPPEIQCLPKVSGQAILSFPSWATPFVGDTTHPPSPYTTSTPTTPHSLKSRPFLHDTETDHHTKACTLIHPRTCRHQFVLYLSHYGTVWYTFWPPKGKDLRLSTEVITSEVSRPNVFTHVCRCGVANV